MLAVPASDNEPSRRYGFRTGHAANGRKYVVVQIANTRHAPYQRLDARSRMALQSSWRQVAAYARRAVRDNAAGASRTSI